ncbi:phosphate/phosphite/phosphonate ABC transporter substrate-binding protein [Roseibacterium beibuensis]|uniref:phosphate/phosphite/phosphonate ABC transporter substrate-binding protein n=1 Tax=[Roseibacterium] beibuensis TaxID=1193142 RepID=UPI00217EED87|nr:phosphate/phosphite/phosphonate ABC transporter substrate-binding protein [Roseibacterium beibuensis]MCS6624750.1 phosphate/phosphite/phosphonate ABC transporter substrate-binding protein [Roseibacterium beibuensis]
MNLPGSVRRLGVGLLALAVFALTGCGRQGEAPASDAPGEIVFSILSAQGQASAAPLWQPLLDDMSKAVGVPVEAHFASTYTALIEDMKAGRTQAVWFSAQPAIQAMEAADAEMVARTVDLNGADSYRSTLIVKRGSGLTLADALACGQRYRFGAGDPQSTSGTLVPMTFLFNPRGIQPDLCFRTVRPGNHETNAFEVAAGVVDVATSNSVTASDLRRRNPTIADQIEEIWRSPPIPEGGILVRGDLDPALKEKIRSFFLTYGQGNGVEAERQRRVLAALNWSRFSAAEDDYLDPVRELIADQALAAARAEGDAEGVAAAQRDLQRLRAKREVQP